MNGSFFSLLVWVVGSQYKSFILEVRRDLLQSA